MYIEKTTDEKHKVNYFANKPVKNLSNKKKKTKRINGKNINFYKSIIFLF